MTHIGNRVTPCDTNLITISNKNGTLRAKYYDNNTNGINTWTNTGILHAYLHMGTGFRLYALSRLDTTMILHTHGVPERISSLCAESHVSKHHNASIFI